MDDNERMQGESNVKKAPVVILVAALLAAIITALIMLFGFQKGLPLGERCHCALNKVFFYSGFSFLAVAAQLISYFTDKAYCAQYEGMDVGEWLNEFAIAGKKKSLLKLSVVAILTTAIEFFGLTFLIDQNQDFLWFIHHGAAGIFCIVGTLVINFAAAFIACLKMPYRSW